MRALAQRVREASVEVEGRIVAEIGPGLLVLIGIADDDQDADCDWLVHKLVNLRVFDDDAGVMNRSVRDVGGDMLAVSQFTLYGSTRKGQRPSWSAAARPEVAQPRFDQCAAALAAAMGKRVPTGIFGAHMRVKSCNDGPVTLWLDSRVRE